MKQIGLFMMLLMFAGLVLSGCVQQSLVQTPAEGTPTAQNSNCFNTNVEPCDFSKEYDFILTKGGECTDWDFAKQICVGE